MGEVQLRVIPCPHRGHGDHGQGGEHRVLEVHLQGHTGEQAAFGTSAAHGPHKVRRLGRSEQLVDELGRLPVAVQGNIPFLQDLAVLHQLAADGHRILSQVANRGSGIDS